MVSALVVLPVKKPQIAPFSLRYKERGKLLLQSVLCIIKPKQLVPQMGREEQRNLQDKIVTSELLVLSCIIYPHNFQHMLLKIIISVQLRGRENTRGTAQKHTTPGKNKRIQILCCNTVIFTVYIWLLLIPALGRMDFFHLFFQLCSLNTSPSVTRQFIPVRA